MARIKLLLINYFANSISFCGSASLAAMTSEAGQTKSCEADFSQRPKQRWRRKTKKITIGYGGSRNISAGKTERRLRVHFNR
jgi:hypothetical protein